MNAAPQDKLCRDGVVLETMIEFGAINSSERLSSIWT